MRIVGLITLIVASIWHTASASAALVIQTEKGEQEIVAATQAAFEKHRKADAKIRVVDAAGRPVPGVKVAVEQISHEFLFGCNIYMFDRYRSKIEFWEVVNEPSHLANPKIDQPYRWAREANPGAYLIVNDYYVLADGGPGFFKLLSAAKHSGVPFDGIGIQAHEPRTMRFPLDRVQEILDQYATLGKDLHIT